MDGRTNSGSVFRPEKTVEDIGHRFVEQGFQHTLDGKKRANPPSPKLLDGEQKAWVIATRLGPLPLGYANGTLRLLASRVVEWEMVESIRHETIRRTLKKRDDSTQDRLWGDCAKKRCGIACSYGKLLDVYERPYDAGNLVICMDEQPVQLIRETRQAIQATEKKPRRVDDEYERAGTTSIFMFAEPLSGWCQATARPQRIQSDWAIEVARWLEDRYAGKKKVTWVCDNLNPHTKGAFYGAFEPERARSLVRRIEFRYPPKHGSWLNIAENELSAMTQQGLAGRRMGDIETLNTPISAGSDDVNGKQGGVDWQMKIGDA